jgi:hypothetical protein
MNERKSHGGRTARFCANVQAIAKAWGARVYAQRGQRERQLAPVIEATRRADFPKRQKFGWSRAEVLAWGADNVAAEGRVIVISEIQRKDAGTQSSQGNGQGELHLDEIARIRKANLLKLHAEGKRLKPEELLEAGVRVAPDLGDDQMVRDCNTTTEVARIISAHFGVDCRKQYISDWRKGERLPTGVPLFPPPDPKSNRYKAAEFIPWYEKYILKRVNGSGATRDLFQNLADERDRAELEEIAHQRFLRERERGDYAPVTIMESCLAGFASAVVSQFDRMVEDKQGLRHIAIEALRALVSERGITSMTDDFFAAYDGRLSINFAAANDALKKQFAEKRDAIAGQIKEQRDVASKY